MKPRIPLTDKRFRYVPAAHTDVRKTFERARAEKLPANVTTFPFRKESK